MVLALLTALSTTVAVVTINNLQSSLRVQRAGVALNAAEAGVSQALSYLRSSGVNGLACWPACPANPWGNQANPKFVDLPGGADARYAVHIQPVTPLTATAAGLYRIHSRGTAGALATRDISVDVSVSTTTVPKGIFARTVSGGGSATVQRASIISTGCVYNRSKIKFSTELDAAYGIPPAVHSSQIITNSNGSGQYCPTTNQPIHPPDGSEPCGITPQSSPTQMPYRYDQDRLGGSLAGTACESVQTAHPNSNYYGPRDLDGIATDGFDADRDGAGNGNDVEGSFIEDDAALLAMFGVRMPVLTQAQLDQLRTISKSQGNYHTSTTPPAPTDSTPAAAVNKWAPDEKHAVLFFDLAGSEAGGVVDLNKIYGFDRSEGGCPDESLIIVIEGGNARLNAQQDLVASLFLTSAAPYGQLLKANGTADFIGSIYADSVDLTGNVDVAMDSCFVNNLSPALLTLSTSNYVEVDR